MIDVRALAPGLFEHEPGLWMAAARSPVSYPSAATGEYRQVEDESFWFRHRNRCIVSLVKTLPPRGPVLDVGGGNGVVAAALSRAGLAAIVVEPSVEGARNARRRGLEPVICATTSSAGFPRASVAAIGLFDVLEHIEDDTAFLRQMHALLQPEGRLYLTVPAYEALWSAEDDYAGHHRRYTLRSLRAALRGAGFDIEYATYFFTFLPLAIVPFRTIPSMLGIRRHAAVAREHRAGGAPIAALVERVLSFEARAIERGISLPFGGSCLVAARAMRRTGTE